MRFEIAFGNPKSGATRFIAVELSDAEVAAARAHAHPDVAAKAYALRHAYKKVEPGFLHDCAGIQRMRPQ